MMNGIQNVRWSIIALALGFISSLTFADDGQIDIFIDPATGYTISAPGSYVVVANVTMTADVAAITIAVGVHDVAINLKGHTLTGSGGGSVDGIDGSGCDRLRVFNGRVKGFSDNGIYAGDEAQIHDVIVADNADYGVRAGNEALVERCTAVGNNKSGGEGGIRVRNNSAVIDCVSSANTPTSTGGVEGIRASSGCTIIGNTVRGNISPNNDSFAIRAADNALILNNTCEGNQSGGTGSAVGIFTGSGCVIANNTCVDNVSNDSGGAFGILADGAGCVVRSNTCAGNLEGPNAEEISFGILAGVGAIVVGNTCRGNGTQGAGGSGRGIHVFGGSLIRENVCEGHTAVGGGEAAVGIVIDGTHNRVENNNCIGQSSTGGAESYGIEISASATNNFISGNNTSDNGTSGIIDQGSSDNLIIGNRASGNGTDFIFGASNSTGPIADETANDPIVTINPLANVMY